MSLAIHPYISGQPHRIKYLEAIYDHVRRFDGVLHWNGAQILDWYKSAVPYQVQEHVERQPLASWPGIAVRRTASHRSPMSRPSTILGTDLP